MKYHLKYKEIVQIKKTHKMILTVHTIPSAFFLVPKKKTRLKKVDWTTMEDARDLKNCVPFHCQNHV